MKIVKRKEFHMCIFLLILIPMLAACRVDFAGKEEFSMKARNHESTPKSTETTSEKTNEETSEQPEQQTGNENPAYTLDGTVTINGENLVVKGTTSLPPGAVVTARMRRYFNDVSLEDIKEYRVEPSSVVDADAFMEVKGDGTFESNGQLVRPDLPFRYRLELIFTPDRAEKAVQEQLTSGGGTIDDLAGMIPIDTFTENPNLKRVVPGYMKYVNILKEDDEGGSNVTLELVPVKNIPLRD